jgi:hypothetical protein
MPLDSQNEIHDRGFEQGAPGTHDAIRVADWTSDHLSPCSGALTSANSVPCVALAGKCTPWFLDDASQLF